MNNANNGKASFDKELCHKCPKLVLNRKRKIENEKS